VTQLKGFIPPSRRPNALGVHSLDHFSLSVPDLERAKRFYTAFGLDVQEQGSRLNLQASMSPHRCVSIFEGPSKALSYLSFGIFADDVLRFKAHLDEGGVERVDPPPGVDSNGLWLRDCNGLLVELKVAEKTSMYVAPAEHAEMPLGSRAAPYRGEAGQVRPVRLAHVMIFVRDVHKSIDFYRRVLGLRLSDEIEGNVAFMHGVHGSDHHIVAFVKSDAPGLHHCSWDVGSFHDVGLGAMQMAENVYKDGWGVGHFVLSSNYFHYVRDPWGSYSEYVSDLDYIPSDVDWEGQSHSAKKAFYLWGPEPTKVFSVNHESQER